MGKMFEHLNEEQTRRLIDIGVALPASKEQKTMTRLITFAHILNGVIKKDKCIICGFNGRWKAFTGYPMHGCSRLVVHHTDYTDPLKVYVLCSKCHGSLETYFRKLFGVEKRALVVIE
jgi:hypothetical protein